MEPVYRDYILSGDVSVIASEFSQAHNLDTTSATALENGIFLFLLFFIDKKAFVKFIMENCSLREREALVLIEAISLSLPINIREIQQKTSLLVFNEEISDGDTDLTFDIAEAEATISTLNAVRTMANDNQMIGQPYKEKMHTSTQSAILNESKSSGQWETGK
jgi:hypothetical protein